MAHPEKTRARGPPNPHGWGAADTRGINDTPSTKTNKQTTLVSGRGGFLRGLALVAATNKNEGGRVASEYPAIAEEKGSRNRCSKMEQLAQSKKRRTSQNNLA